MLDLPYGAQAFSGCAAWASLALASGPRCPAACGILVPRPGIKPVSPTLKGEFLTLDQLESLKVS